MSFEMAYNQNYRKEKKTLQQHFLTFVQKKKKIKIKKLIIQAIFFSPHYAPTIANYDQIIKEFF